MATAAKPVATAEPAVHTGPIQDAINDAQPRALSIAEPAANDPTTAPQLLVFTPAQVDIIKHMYMPGATDDELAVFILICTSRQLNPFTKQIYAIKRKQKRDGQWVQVWTHQTSIDGFRLIAKRTGKYRGRTTPLFCGPDGVWTEAWLHEYPPTAAKVGVLHADFDAPIYAVALWREYAATFDDGNLMGMWAKMPSVMLSKVGEALVLRVAFPEELSGLYTDDEMAQANNAERAEARRQATTQNGDRAAGSGGTGDPYTGAGSTPARPADPYVGIDPEDPITLEVARALPLVGAPPRNGKPGAWGGFGQKPLGDVPYDLLTRAYQWFGEKLSEHFAAESAGGKLAEDKAILAPTQLHKFHVMRAAIPVVIADLDRAQGTLPLDGAPAPITKADIAASGGLLDASDQTPAERSEADDSDFPLDRETLLEELKNVMDHPLMPASAREYFARKVMDGIKTITAAKFVLSLAQLAYEIGDELVTCVDKRQEKEILGLLKHATTYKPDTLKGIRDQLRAATPGGG